jgi:hypothetical protein
MKILLGKGYWIDASDGLNWTLYVGGEPASGKKGKLEGHYGNLFQALRGAVAHGIHMDPELCGLDDLGERLDREVDAIMDGVTVEVVKDKRLGLVKKFSAKATVKAI